MTLNASKTKICPYGRKQTLKQVKNLTLTYNKHKLPTCNDYTYLGIIIDSNLNFEKNYGLTKNLWETIHIY